MTINLHAGDAFPDFELPDHRNQRRRLSRYTKPSPLDERLGFDDGYPLPGLPALFSAVAGADDHVAPEERHTAQSRAVADIVAQPLERRPVDGL